MAQDVARLLDQLGAHPAHVIGLSLGGCVALALALVRPDLVRQLVLVNSFARFQAGQGASRARARQRLQVLLTGTPQQMAAFVADGLFPRPDQAALHAAAMASLAYTPRAVCFHALAAAARFDVRGKLGRIVAPTLVVSGARDTTVPAQCSRELTLGIPGAYGWVLPDSGHATPMDQAALFNERVVRFLMRDDGRSSL
jgi:pimeloyl-ACP methyl ester carboxylesterase